MMMMMIKCSLGDDATLRHLWQPTTNCTRWVCGARSWTYSNDEAPNKAASKSLADSAASSRARVRGDVQCAVVPRTC